MTKSHKKISFIFLILVLLVGLWLIYQFPVQKYLAEQKFIEYTSLQRVDLQDIRSQKFLKDYKTGGYDIEVEYKSDPGLTYEYSYAPPFWRRLDCFLTSLNAVQSGTPAAPHTPSRPPAGRSAQSQTASLLPATAGCRSGRA